MALKVTPEIFMETILGIVTMVWASSFVVTLIDSKYDASQYNNIFMVVVGSGAFATAFAKKFTKSDRPHGRHTGGDKP